MPKLLPDYDLTSVERALSEIRSGRPVVLTDLDRSALVIGIETIGDALLSEIGRMAHGKAHLVLPAARLRRLGLDRQSAGTIALPVLDRDRIEALALRTDTKFDSPVGPTSALDRAGIELASLALILPALILVPLDEERLAGEALLCVKAEAVEQYRRRHHAKVDLISRAYVPLDQSHDTEFVIFRGGEGLRDQVAIIVGKPDLASALPVRLHSACLTGDLFGSLKCDCGDQLRQTVQWMSENGGGVLLYLDQEGRGNGLANKIRAYRLQAQGFDTYEADEALGFEMDQRKFDFAAAMLSALGIARVTLLTNNPDKIAALRRAGIEVVAHQRIFGRTTPENIRYMATKRDRAGHMINVEDRIPPKPALGTKA